MFTYVKYAYEWKSNDSLILPRENPKSIDQRLASREEGSNPGGA